MEDSYRYAKRAGRKRAFGLWASEAGAAEARNFVSLGMTLLICLAIAAILRGIKAVLHVVQMD